MTEQPICLICKKPVSDDDLVRNMKGEPMHHDCRREERALWELPNAEDVTI
jgi:hypothetical protein